jgi:hypothetical protein
MLRLIKNRLMNELVEEILTRHTKNNASGNGNKKPERMLKNIDPGIANDCKLINKLIH